MFWVTIISGSIFALSFGWSLIKLADHLAKEQTKFDEVVWCICFITAIIALTSICILVFTPLHTYGWYS